MAKVQEEFNLQVMYARSIVVSTRYIFRMQVLGNNVGLLKSDFNPRF